MYASSTFVLLLVSIQSHIISFILLLDVYHVKHNMLSSVSDRSLVLCKLVLYKLQ